MSWGPGPFGSGGPVAFATPMAADRNGNVYVASGGIINRIHPDGTKSIVGGGGTSSDEGRPATAMQS